jgi:uncharacterized protein YggE
MLGWTPFVIAASVALAADAPAATPTPAPTACRRPSVPAITLRAAEPVLPWTVTRLGLSGTVIVRITLDAQSHITDAQVQSSTVEQLRAPAFEAARRSVFQTEVRDCVPRPGTYLFSVDIVNDLPPAYVDEKSNPPVAVVNGRGSVDAPVGPTSLSLEFAAEDTDAAPALAAVDAAYTRFQAKMTERGFSWYGVTQYRRSRGGWRTTASPAKVGYFAELRVQGRIPSDQVTQVLGLAVDAGAWSGRVMYGMQPEASSVAAAAARAVADGGEVAAQLGGRRGLHVGRVITSETLSTSHGPVRDITYASLRSHDFGPEVRTFELSVVVRTTFALEP